MLSCGDPLLYLGTAMRTIWFYSLQRATTILDQVFTNYSICINVSKTESMILNYMLLEDEYPDTIISFHNVPFQNSIGFKHFGLNISLNKPNMEDIEINHRIQIVYTKFATMTNFLQSSKIRRKTRVKFLKSFIRRRLTYF